MALKLETRIAAKVKGSVVALALDGWTKWNHTKTINFLMIWNGVAIFWKTIPTFYGKSARNMMSLVKVAIEHIEKRFDTLAVLSFEKMFSPLATK
jgi:hypothetical protein